MRGGRWDVRCEMWEVGSLMSDLNLVSNLTSYVSRLLNRTNALSLNYLLNHPQLMGMPAFFRIKDAALVEAVEANLAGGMEDVIVF